MLFRKIFNHFSLIKFSIRTFSHTSRLYTKEFIDRHIQSLINDNEFASMSSALLHIRSAGHRVYIIQPSMKFKARGRQSTTAQLQLSESIALIETLNKWRVVGHGIYTLKTGGSQRYLYGKGNVEKITNEVHECQATAVFVSIDRLSLVQIDGLTEKFRVPVYDRYSIVLQIFKNHAQSGAAKLQVALAEIPLLRYRKNDSELFKDREQNLRAEVAKLEQHRKLLKKRRLSIDIPTVAVVGYTNAGKTSLIKALTKDASLQPKNQLFATLDVTTYAGVLPNALNVLYVDTVGFIADIPTTLIEAFRATLNDAIDAHLIIHVCDISHPDYVVQYKTVIQTLRELDIPSSKLESIITVFNKYDLLNQQTSDEQDNNEDEEEEKIFSQKSIPDINIENNNRLYISCKTNQGLNQLTDILQKKLMIASDRITCVYRVLQGGQYYQVLVNDDICTIENMIVDEHDPQFIHLKCLFSKAAYAKFQAHYSGASKYQISNDS
ncbi:unnamed protein product [Rotaria sordida]|uniref:Hflx-type G domain-containing protein n=1 Tax=Rotaria sordida TaxID=392033 RepID=A0A818SXH5_9BILA|nr:unnamed protein product [Rotaria sordida]CAF3677006.1 unnamed protein product [Rotaria sordida]